MPRKKKETVEEQAIKQDLRNLSAETLETLRRELFSLDEVSGLSKYQIYIKNFLDAAIDDPNSKSGQLLAAQIVNEGSFKRMDEQLQKSINSNAEYQIWRLRQTMFKEQQEVFDNTHDKSVMVICSRRAGKTEMNARLLIRAVMTGAPTLYLNKTVGNAIKQMWEPVMTLTRMLELGVKKSSKAEHIIEYANGASIMFGGVNDIASIDKYRGFKYRLIVVDEVGHLSKNAEYLINDVLKPATADFANSQMFFTGTPPRVKNYATRLWHSNIRKYHWTAVNNPHIPDFDKFIAGICKEKGLSRADPYIRREYYGDMDAYDVEAMIFRDYKRYSGDPLNQSDFNPDRIFIGIDWGFVDHNAIVSFLADSVRKRAVVYDVWTAGKTGADDLKAMVQRKHLDAVGILSNLGYDNPNVRIVCDTNEPAIAADLAKLHLPIEKAYKVDMMKDVEDLAADLRTGRCVVDASWEEDTNELIRDLNTTVYARDDQSDELIPEIDDITYHPNAIHALRYAMRAFRERPQEQAASVSPVNTTRPSPIQIQHDYDTVEMIVI